MRVLLSIIFFVFLLFIATSHAQHFMNTLNVTTVGNDSEVNSVAYQDYIRNNCSSSDQVQKCGTIEYMGCTGSKKFYHESAFKMDWFEAWEYCRSMGLHLAAIENRYEQTFIELFLPPLGVASTETYWTSGTDLGREGKFSWMATGRSMTFGNFRPGEPNNRFGSENCIELIIKPDVVGYLWNDRNCLAKGYVLCQHDVRYPDKPFDFNDSSEV